LYLVGTGNQRNRSREGTCTDSSERLTMSLYGAAVTLADKCRVGGGWSRVERDTLGRRGERERGTARERGRERERDNESGVGWGVRGCQRHAVQPQHHPDHPLARSLTRLLTCLLTRSRSRSLAPSLTRSHTHALAASVVGFPLKRPFSIGGVGAPHRLARGGALILSPPRYR